ncbi:MAG: RICIN domain-containing protein [Acidimicrobiales bacterium]
MSKWLVEKGSSLLGARTSRRNFLVRSAMAGSALAVAPVRYILQPGTAYAAICSCAGTDCDCGSACCDGYTDFCCSINNGSNTCPPGTFEAGWWRADGSSFCNDGPRYYVDCNVQCGNTSYPCRCGQDRCDHRRSACNQFRYGNCHREIECYGPIACRVVSCTPPYQLYASCDQTTLWDDSTANHTADCPAPQPPRSGNQVFAQHSEKVFEVADASFADGAPIRQWTPGGALHQRWAAERQPDGTYRIVAAHSGKVLDVADSSTADGGLIHQWTWHGGANQRWRIEDAGGGYTAIVSVHSGKVLDVSQVSRADGAPIHQWTWYGGASQKWRGLITNPTNPTPPTTPPPVPPPGKVVTAAHSGKVLDVSEVSTADGAAIWQWSPTGAANQRWVVEPLLDGTFRFVAAHSGKVLDVAEFSTADGGRIHQWTWHGGANQRWRIENLLDGTARVVSVHSGKVLDVSQVSQSDGALIHQWTWHGGTNQRWRGLV